MGAIILYPKHVTKGIYYFLEIRIAIAVGKHNVAASRMQ